MTNSQLRKRYATLGTRGRLTPAGINRAPTRRGYDTPPRLPFKVPPHIQAALRKRPAALWTFEGLAPSHRRKYVGWIDSEKREETKARRLNDVVRLLAAGKPLGLQLTADTTTPDAQPDNAQDTTHKLLIDIGSWTFGELHSRQLGVQAVGGRNFGLRSSTRLAFEIARSSVYGARTSTRNVTLVSLLSFR